MISEVQKYRSSNLIRLTSESGEATRPRMVARVSISSLDKTPSNAGGYFLSFPDYGTIRQRKVS